MEIRNNFLCCWCYWIFRGNIFYDSLLVSVSSQDQRNQVSSLGLFNGLSWRWFALLLNVLMFSYPSFFGLSSQIEAVLVL